MHNCMVRNRLGTEKAAKLMFLFKAFNQQQAPAEYSN